LKDVIATYYEDDRYIDILDDAITLNKAMLKIPSDCSEKTISLHYNILEHFTGIKLAEPCPLLKVDTKYTILHNSTWDDRKDWMKKVVWWGKQSADYLWSVENAINDK